MILGFLQSHDVFFNDTSNLLTQPFSKLTYCTIILIPALRGNWVTQHFNSSQQITKVHRHDAGIWTDRILSPLAFGLDDGGVQTSVLAILVSLVSPNLKIINDVIVHLFDCGIFIQITNRVLNKGKI